MTAIQHEITEEDGPLDPYFEDCIMGILNDLRSHILFYEQVMAVEISDDHFASALQGEDNSESRKNIMEEIRKPSPIAGLFYSNEGAEPQIIPISIDDCFALAIERIFTFKVIEDIQEIEKEFVSAAFRWGVAHSIDSHWNIYKTNVIKAVCFYSAASLACKYMGYHALALFNLTEAAKAVGVASRLPFETSKARLNKAYEMGIGASVGIRQKEKSQSLERQNISAIANKSKEIMFEARVSFAHEKWLSEPTLQNRFATETADRLIKKYGLQVPAKNTLRRYVATWKQQMKK